MKKAAVILFFAFLCAACGEPKINTGSQEAFKKSLTKVRKNLTAEEREMFGEALGVIANDRLMRQIDLAFSQHAENQAVVPQTITKAALVHKTIADEFIGSDGKEVKLFASVNGKKYAEVIEQAKEIKSKKPFRIKGYYNPPMLTHENIQEKQP